MMIRTSRTVETADLVHHIVMQPEGGDDVNTFALDWPMYIPFQVLEHSENSGECCMCSSVICCRPIYNSGC